MVTFFAVLHILFCLGLIGFVLLQDPKGGASGVFGGAGANQLLGTTGAANLLTKMTSIFAIAFGVTCIVMSILSAPSGSSVVDSAPATTNSTAAEKTDTAPVAPSTEKTPAPEAQK